MASYSRECGEGHHEKRCVSEAQWREGDLLSADFRDGNNPESERVFSREQQQTRQLAGERRPDPPHAHSVLHSGGMTGNTSESVVDVRGNPEGDVKFPQSQSQALQMTHCETEGNAGLGLCKLKRVKSDGCVLKRQQLVCSSSLPITTCYHLGEVIGIGTWGTVQTAVERFSGLERVVKRVSKELHQHEMPRFRQEIQLCRQLDHPNIVRLYETFEDHKYIYLVLKYCRGGDLLSWVHRRQDAIAAGARARRRKRKRGGGNKEGATREDGEHAFGDSGSAHVVEMPSERGSPSDAEARIEGKSGEPRCRTDQGSQSGQAQTIDEGGRKQEEPTSLSMETNVTANAETRPGNRLDSSGSRVGAGCTLVLAEDDEDDDEEEPLCSEIQAARFMLQLLSALCYLHQKGIAHRDIKLENLLLVHPFPADERLPASQDSELVSHEEAPEKFCPTPSLRGATAVRPGEEEEVADSLGLGKDADTVLGVRLERGGNGVSGLRPRARCPLSPDATDVSACRRGEHFVPPPELSGSARRKKEMPDSIALVDFGLARRFGGGGSGSGERLLRRRFFPRGLAGGVLRSGGPMSSCVGTLYYLSPFMLKGLPYDEVQCDMWAAGVVLYILISGAPPFDGNTEAEIYDKILRTRVSFSAPCWRSVSEECKDLVSRLLHNPFAPQSTYPGAALPCDTPADGVHRSSACPDLSKVVAVAPGGGSPDSNANSTSSVPCEGSCKKGTEQDWLPGVLRRMDAATTLTHPWFASVQRQLWVQATLRPASSISRSLSTPSFLHGGHGGRCRCSGSNYPSTTAGLGEVYGQKLTSSHSTESPAASARATPSALYNGGPDGAPVYVSSEGERLAATPCLESSRRFLREVDVCFSCGQIKRSGPADFRVSQKVRAAPLTKLQNREAPESGCSLLSWVQENPLCFGWDKECRVEHDERAVWRAGGNTQWTVAGMRNAETRTEESSPVFFSPTPGQSDRNTNCVAVGSGTVSVRDAPWAQGASGENRLLTAFCREQRPPAARQSPAKAVRTGQHMESSKIALSLVWTTEEMDDLLRAFRLGGSPLHFCWSPGCTVLREEASGSHFASASSLVRSIQSYPRLVRARRSSTASLQEGSSMSFDRSHPIRVAAGERDRDSERLQEDSSLDTGGATDCCGVSCVLRQCGTEALRCLCCPSASRGGGVEKEEAVNCTESGGRLPFPETPLPSPVSGAPSSDADFATGSLPVPHLHLYVGDTGTTTASRLAARGDRTPLGGTSVACFSGCYDSAARGRSAGRLCSSACSGGNLPRAVPPSVQLPFPDGKPYGVGLKDVDPWSPRGRLQQAGSGKDEPAVRDRDGSDFGIRGGAWGTTYQMSFDQETGDSRAVPVSVSEADVSGSARSIAAARGCPRCARLSGDGTYVEQDRGTGNRLASGPDKVHDGVKGEFGVATADTSPPCCLEERRGGPPQGEEEGTVHGCVSVCRNARATGSVRGKEGVQTCSSSPALLGGAQGREERQTTFSRTDGGSVVTEENLCESELVYKQEESGQVTTFVDDCYFTERGGIDGSLVGGRGECPSPSCACLGPSCPDYVGAQREPRGPSVLNSCSPTPGSGTCCCSSCQLSSESASTCASASPRTKSFRVPPFSKIHPDADCRFPAPLSYPVCSGDPPSQSDSLALPGCACPSSPKGFRASASSPPPFSGILSPKLVHHSATHREPLCPTSRAQQEETDKREEDFTGLREAVMCHPFSTEHCAAHGEKGSVRNLGGKGRGFLFWKCVSLTEPEQAGVFRSRNLLLVAATAWQRFAALGPLQRALRTVLAREMEDEPGVQVLREVFYALDRHHRGAVEPGDVQWGLSLAREFATAECVCCFLEDMCLRKRQGWRAAPDAGLHEGYCGLQPDSSGIRRDGDQNLVWASANDKSDCFRAPQCSDTNTPSVCTDTFASCVKTSEAGASSGPEDAGGIGIDLVSRQTAEKVTSMPTHLVEENAQQQTSSESRHVADQRFTHASDFLVSPSLPPELHSLLRLAGLSSSGVVPPLGELLPYVFNLHALLGVRIPEFFGPFWQWVTLSSSLSTGKKQRALRVTSSTTDEGEARGTAVHIEKDAILDALMLKADHDKTMLNRRLRSAADSRSGEKYREGEWREGEPWRLKDVIAGMDTDGSGTIEFVEFLAASLGDGDLRRREILCRAAYRYFDRNFDGLVCYRDLLGVLSLQPGTSESMGACKATMEVPEVSSFSADLATRELPGCDAVGSEPTGDAVESEQLVFGEDEGFLQDLEHVNTENLPLYRAVLSELKAVDGDHDGFITYEEFLCLLH